MKTVVNFLLLISLFFSSFLPAQNIYHDTYQFHSIFSSHEAAIEATPEGGFIFVNNIELDYSTNSSLFEIPFIIGKKAADGTTLWLEQYDPFPDSDVAFYPISIKYSPIDQTFVHAGYLFLPDGTQQIYLQKIDDSGMQIWFNTYDCAIGGDDASIKIFCGSWEFTAIDINSEGIIAGIGSISEQFGSSGLFVFYVHEDGSFGKAKLFGSDDIDFPKNGVMIKHYETDFFVLGESRHFNPNNEYIQPIVMRIDAQMNVIWRKIYSDLTTASHLFTMETQDMVITGGGICIIQGIRNREFYSDLNEIYLIAIGPNGNHLWDNTFSINTPTGDSGFLRTYMAIDFQDQVYIGFNQRLAFNNHGNLNYELNPGLIKTNAGGTPQWYKTMIGSAWDLHAEGIAIVEGDNQFMIGMIGQANSQQHSVAGELWLSSFSGNTGENDCIGEDKSLISKNIEYFSLDYLLEEKEVSMDREEQGIDYHTPTYTPKRCGFVLY